MSTTWCSWSECFDVDPPRRPPRFIYFWYADTLTSVLTEDGTNLWIWNTPADISKWKRLKCDRNEIITKRDPLQKLTTRLLLMKTENQMPDRIAKKTHSSINERPISFWNAATKRQCWWLVVIFGSLFQSKKLAKRDTLGQWRIDKSKLIIITFEDGLLGQEKRKEKKNQARGK